MLYRKEVDGLRAIAVVSVILYHAGLEAVSGGFVGVDIFFVISGYLITSIIMKDLEAERFSIGNFYERRFRRILPALIFIELLCIPIAVLWLPTARLEEFANSLVAVSFFSSNILFWQESGYFGLDIPEKPLIHTWSLAIEEQYYLFFPLLMVFFWKLDKKKSLVVMIVSIAVVSFIVAEWASRNHPTANFYLIPSRAWELFIGSLTAIYLNKQAVSDRSINEVPAVFGLLLIMYSIVYFDKSTPFPGSYALVPTLGTALIILFATQKTSLNKLLSMKVLVGIGLVSYSAYLWHQPLFAFARVKSFDAPETSVFLMLSVVSVAMAYFSWRYVESPFRNKNFLKQKSVFMLSIISSLFIAIIGVLIHLYSEKISESYLTVPRHMSTKECLEVSLKSYPENCLIGASRNHERPIDVILWGDSYADALAFSLRKKLEDSSLKGLALIKHSCPSIMGVIRKEPIRLGSDFSDKCHEYSRNSVNEIVASDARIVVLTSSYRYYFNNKNQLDAPVLVSESSESSAIKNLVETIDVIIKSGKKVVLVLPHAYRGKDEFKKYLKMLYFHGSEAASFPIDNTASDEIVNGIMKQLSFYDFNESLQLIHPNDILCPGGVECYAMSVDKQLLLSDGSHFSLVGADKVVELIKFR